MDTQYLEIFVEAATLGSFAEVARRQDRDPSQISRGIAHLEGALQVRLFKRSTRKLSLTEAGERYLARVRPVLDELRYAEEEARQQNQTPSGLLRLTASTAFGQICLLPQIASFRQTYPDIELDLQFTDRNVDLLIENTDIAVRLAPAFQSELIGIKLFDTHYRVCASPGYLETHGPIAQPEELSQHACVVLALAQYNEQWRFKSPDGKLVDVNIKGNLSVSNALALRECLLSGFGPGLAADWLVDEAIRRGDLVDLFPGLQVTATDFNTGVWLLYHSRHYLPTKTRVMIDFLKQHLLL